MEQRKRTTFTEIERAVLMDLVNKHKAVVESKKSDGASLEKKKTWKLLTDEYNCRIDVRPRTEAQLRKCWDNLKEKWRKAKAADMKEIFAAGGGPPPPTQLDDELNRVGDVAAHMDTRVWNPFDSDGGRYRNSGANSLCTPSVAALLEATQAETQEADDGFNFTWDHEIQSSREAESAEPAEVVPEACSSRDHHEQQQSDHHDQQHSNKENDAAVRASCRATLAPPQTAENCRRRAAGQAAPAQKESLLSGELRARLQAVSTENKRKRKEHVPRMRQMKAEHELRMKNALEMHALETTNKKAKLELLQLKIAELKKK